MRVLAAFFYLLLGETYLVLHWSQWTPARSVLIFVTFLGCAYYQVRASQAKALA